MQHQPAELADTPPVRGAAPSSFYGGAGRQAPAARRSILFGARMPQPAPAPAAPRAAVPATAAVLFFDDDSVDSIHSLQLSTPPMARTLSAQAREARKLVFRLTLQNEIAVLGEKYVGRTCFHSFFLLHSWGHPRRWSSARCHLAQWPQGGPSSSSSRGWPTRGGPGPRGGRGSGAPRPPQAPSQDRHRQGPHWRSRDHLTWGGCRGPQGGRGSGAPRPHHSAPTQACRHLGLRRGCLTRGGPGPRGRWEEHAAHRHHAAAPRPTAQPGRS